MIIHVALKARGKIMKILIGYVISKESCGINKYLYNVLNALKNENVEIHVLTSDYSENLEEIIRGYNARLIPIERLVHPIKRYKQTKELVLREKYDIAYFNISEAMNCICNVAVKRNTKSTIITHSHSAGSDENNFLKRNVFKIMNLIARTIICRNSDYFYACSRKAGDWSFGNKITSTDRFLVIRNTINTKLFTFNQTNRDVIRQKLNIKNDDMVYGFVGNLVYQKNPLFLIQVFNKILQRDKHCKLVIVGDGILRRDMEELISVYQIEEMVRFVGTVSNVHAYMSAMDRFLFPSNFEGLGIVGIEAQTNGLDCYFSDGLPEEVAISNYATFIPLSKSADEWANFIVEQPIKQRSDIVYDRQIITDSELQKEEFKNIFIKGCFKGAKNEKIKEG